MPHDMELFHILDSVDSTNNYAMGMVRQGLWKHGNACFALEQTAGKGRRGREWKSSNNENIILSLVVNPGFLKLYQQFYLSLITSLSCHELFSMYAKDSVKIKWPNDIYWNDRKAAGILIENVIKGNQWQWSIVGIGMNINQNSFDSELLRPVSLKQITGLEFNVVDLAKELYSLFFKYYDQLLNDSIEGLLEKYNRHLYGRNEIVKLRFERQIFETEIRGVSGDGALLTYDVMDRKFEFDQVEWLI